MRRLPALLADRSSPSSPLAACSAERRARLDLCPGSVGIRAPAASGARVGRPVGRAVGGAVGRAVGAPSARPIRRASAPAGSAGARRAARHAR